VIRTTWKAPITLLVVLAVLSAPEALLGREVGARLKDVGIYIETPVRGQPFYAVKQRSLSPSDKRATIYSEWLLPAPGYHTVQYQIHGPSGALYLANTHPFDATEPVWPTWFTFALPKGEKAKAMAGAWRAEVFLDGDRVATLDFQLTDQDRRIESDVSIAVFPFVVEDTGKVLEAGSAAERAEALAASASYLASELQRLFPRVIPPQQSRTLLGEAFTLADVDKPARLFRIRQRLGAELAMAGRVVVPDTGPANASLEVTLVTLTTGRTERFTAALSERRAGLGSRELVEELTIALLVQPSFVASLRTHATPPPKPAAANSRPNRSTEARIQAAARVGFSP